jgi:hypothetical protein
MPSVAIDLRTAFNYLDPERPLETPEELNEWFCEREGSPRSELAERLRIRRDAPDKYLFSGHRGSGKTTELSKLAQELRDEFFIVPVPATQDLDLYDLDASDLVVAMISRLVQSGREHLDKAALEQVESLTEVVTRELVMERPAGVTVEAGLDLKILKVGAKLGKEAVTRETLRKEVRPRLTEFLDTATLLGQSVRKGAGKPVLVIVEDLDKMDPKPASELFFGRSSVLRAPGFSVIYTFPIALRHHPSFPQIRMGFSEGHVLPNFPVRKRGGGRNEEAIEQMVRIARARVGQSVFPAEVARELAWLSGGLVREFIRLGRNACIAALQAERTSVSEADIEVVRRKGVEEFDLLLTKEQRKLLASIRASQELGDNDEANRELLHTLSALEYRDHEPRPYYDVHPLAEPLLPAPKRVARTKRVRSSRASKR